MSDLNPYFQPINAPVTTRTFIPGAHFEAQYEVQGRNLKASNLLVRNLVQTSGTVSALGTLANGESLGFTAILGFTAPHKDDSTFALPYIAIYQGTAQDANFQIFPVFGGSIPGSQWRGFAAYDFQQYSGTSTAYSGVIENVSAGTKALLIVLKMRYLQYNATNTTV